MAEIKPKGLDVEEVRAECNHPYPTPGCRDIAKALPIVAELIAENFDPSQISFNVHPRELYPGVEDDAFPIHFVLFKDGKPKVALVVPTAYGANAPRVVKTRLLCQRLGLNYVKIYANGTYGDWIQGEWHGKSVSQETVEMCRRRNVERINEALNH